MNLLPVLQHGFQTMILQTMIILTYITWSSLTDCSNVPCTFLASDGPAEPGQQIKQPVSHDVDQKSCLLRSLTMKPQYQQEVTTESDTHFPDTQWPNYKIKRWEWRALTGPSMANTGQRMPTWNQQVLPFTLLPHVKTLDYIPKTSPEDLFPYLTTDSFLKQNTKFQQLKIITWVTCPMKIYQLTLAQTPPFLL